MSSNIIDIPERKRQAAAHYMDNAQEFQLITG